MTLSLCKVKGWLQAYLDTSACLTATQRQVISKPDIMCSSTWYTSRVFHIFIHTSLDLNAMVYCKCYCV